MKEGRSGAAQQQPPSSSEAAISATILASSTPLLLQPSKIAQRLKRRSLSLVFFIQCRTVIVLCRFSDKFAHALVSLNCLLSSLYPSFLVCPTDNAFV